MQSITESLAWPELRPYFKIELYSRDGKRGRKRIEVKRIEDRTLLDRALSLKVICPGCDSRFHSPIRARNDGSLYFASSCPLDVSVKCSRSKAASREYERVIADVERHGYGHGDPAPEYERK